MTWRWFGCMILYAAAACAAGSFCNAQQKAPGAVSEADEAATLRVTTRTVEIATVVHDKSGEPQNKLSESDFILKVDGKEQPIQHFAMASDLPLTLALLVDVVEANAPLSAMSGGRVTSSFRACSHARRIARLLCRSTHVFASYPHSQMLSAASTWR